MTTIQTTMAVSLSLVYSRTNAYLRVDIVDVSCRDCVWGFAQVAHACTRSQQASWWRDHRRQMSTAIHTSRAVSLVRDRLVIAPLFLSLAVEIV
eukprot:m.403838 g.403838  ORF g.403838 m.403838 type:complete len:94 (-) comp56468_c0_seq3:114-395(-)